MGYPTAGRVRSALTTGRSQRPLRACRMGGSQSINASHRWRRCVRNRCGPVDGLRPEEGTVHRVTTAGSIGWRQWIKQRAKTVPQNVQRTLPSGHESSAIRANCGTKFEPRSGRHEFNSLGPLGPTETDLRNAAPRVSPFCNAIARIGPFAPTDSVAERLAHTPI